MDVKKIIFTFFAFTFFISGNVFAAETYKIVIFKKIGQFCPACDTLQRNLESLKLNNVEIISEDISNISNFSGKGGKNDNVPIFTIVEFKDGEKPHIISRQDSDPSARTFESSPLNNNNIRRLIYNSPLTTASNPPASTSKPKVPPKDAIPIGNIKPITNPRGTIIRYELSPPGKPDEVFMIVDKDKNRLTFDIIKNKTSGSSLYLYDIGKTDPTGKPIKGVGEYIPPPRQSELSNELPPLPGDDTPPVSPDPVNYPWSVVCKPQPPTGTPTSYVCEVRDEKGVIQPDEKYTVTPKTPPPHKDAKRPFDALTESIKDGDVIFYNPKTGKTAFYEAPMLPKKQEFENKNPLTGEVKGKYEYTAGVPTTKDGGKTYIVPITEIYCTESACSTPKIIKITVTIETGNNDSKIGRMMQAQALAILEAYKQRNDKKRDDENPAPFKRIKSPEVTPNRQVADPFDKEAPKKKMLEQRLKEIDAELDDLAKREEAALKALKNK